MPQLLFWSVAVYSWHYLATYQSVPVGETIQTMSLQEINQWILIWWTFLTMSILIGLVCLIKEYIYKHYSIS